MLDEPLATGRGRLLKRLLRVHRQRIPERADGLVVADVDGRGTLARPLPVIPGAHQRVLNERQLILIVAEIVEHAVHQPGRDRSTADGHRTGDRRAQRVARHPAHQVQAGVHGLRQPGEIHAVADEVGPHRQDDVDRGFALASGFDQQANERDGIVARARVPASAKPEELLELIDEHQQVLVFRNPRQADRVHEPGSAPPDRRFHQDIGRRRNLVVAGAEHVAVGKRARQVADRIFAWTKNGHAPGRARPGHEAALQGGDQSGSNERGLAAS